MDNDTVKPSLVYCRNCGCSSCPSAPAGDGPTLRAVVRNALPTRRTWFAASFRLAVAGGAYVASTLLPSSIEWLATGASKIALVWSAIGLVSHVEGKFVSGMADVIFGKESGD